MKKIHTEKELLLSQQKQMHTIDSLLKNNSIALEELDEILPGFLHINRADFTVTFMGKNVADEVGITKEDYVSELGARVPVELVHQITYDIGTVDRFLRQMEEADCSKIITNFQYFRKAPDLPFQWVITNTKLMKSSTGDLHYLGFSNELHKTGELANKFEKILECNHFMQKNYLKFASLTKQEVEILKLIAEGKSRNSISEQLFISKHTYDTHRKNIRRKLEIKGISDFVKYAEAFGL